MWVLTPLGFFSIVAHRQKPRVLLVRARVEADLKAFARRLPKPKPKLLRTPTADYPFRLEADRDVVGELLASLTAELAYPNFKNEVARRQGPERSALYHEVWETLQRLERSPDKLHRTNTDWLPFE